MSLDTLSLTTWRNMLSALSAMLDKASAAEAPLEMSDRLAPDMLPLATQIRMLANFPRQALNTLASAELASDEEDPTDFASAKARIAETLALMDTVDASSFIADDAIVDLDLPNGMQFQMSAADYMRDWIFPNFYFHVSIAYAIMRNKGVDLGKADLVPHMMRHIKS